MIRRAAWLGTGMVMGVGATVWARRRVEAVSKRIRAGTLPADVVEGVQSAIRSGGARVGGALSGGLADAREREEHLRRELRLVDELPRTSAHPSNLRVLPAPGTGSG